MVDRSKKISELPLVSVVANTDLVIIVANTSGTANTKRVTANNFRNSIIFGSVPADSTSNGFTGQLAYDTNYLYICVANNTWKRVTLSSY